ncbi:amidohydrolase family protein [Clostridium sp. C8-1-8]|uniref:amidohydrolase family protein n=1 Tax=Clostridium sp. C8-1-8 TaxID=2698831 RepID=UPI0013710894|nr:amidohydrolase family protein [Clostridium sp. C8-1-8]
MFIDIHVHPAFFEPINLDPKITEFRHKALDIQKNGLAPLEHIFNQMGCAGLDKLTLLPEDYTTTDGGIVVSNEEIKKLVDMAPERFIGFAAVDPFVKGHLDAIEKAFTDLKLKGLKLHPSKQHFYPSDKSLEPLYKICEKYDKPILFHSGLSWEPNTLSKYSRPIEFEELALNHPKLRICLAHFGWPYVQETAMLMLKFPNVYADTALLYFDSAREFYKRVFNEDIPSTWIDRSLRHQVMFGSNNPRFEQIRMAEAIDSLGFRESTLELIKGQNALEFIGGI